MRRQVLLWPSSSFRIRHQFRGVAADNVEPGDRPTSIKQMEVPIRDFGNGVFLLPGDKACQWRHAANDLPHFRNAAVTDVYFATATQATREIGARCGRVITRMMNTTSITIWSTMPIVA